MNRDDEDSFSSRVLSDSDVGLMIQPHSNWLIVSNADGKELKFNMNAIESIKASNSFNFRYDCMNSEIIKVSSEDFKPFLGKIVETTKPNWFSYLFDNGDISLFNGKKISSVKINLEKSKVALYYSSWTKDVIEVKPEIFAPFLADIKRVQRSKWAMFSNKDGKVFNINMKNVLYYNFESQTKLIFRYVGFGKQVININPEEYGSIMENINLCK